MLKIFNTLGREYQEFETMDDGIVKFYQCGPTVYSRQHIGNLSSAVGGDLIRRALIYLGYDVRFARNITDVGHLTGDNEGDADSGEDKMAKGAKREKMTPEGIAAKYSKLYHDDIHELNVLDPDYETIATEYVEEMAEMVQDLINRGYAYAREKAIYFDVDKFEDYNKLNLQKLDKNIVGAGHGSEGDSEKKNPYDFALWFFKTGAHKNALQTWEHEFRGIEQPILEGFPGWHIECSAMAKDTLGVTIDIHMGGVEHIPVHHTNEIAQSEAANDKEFSRFWIHHELLLIDGGKMSKSLGNVYSLDDLKDKGFDPIDYRYFLLQAHYRSKQNFTWEALESAKVALAKLVRALKQFKADSKSEGNVSEDFKQEFVNALEDDFNIPKGLAVVWEVTKTDLSPEDKLATILDFDKVLGLDLAELIEESSQEVSAEVKKLIAEREEARENRDWAKADEIRDVLKNEHGIEIEDTNEGTKIVSV